MNRERKKKKILLGLNVQPLIRGEGSKSSTVCLGGPAACLLARLMVDTGRWSVGAGSQASLLWPSTPGMWLMAAEEAVCMCTTCSMRLCNWWGGTGRKENKGGGDLSTELRY